jgi:hypothetical protein
MGFPFSIFFNNFGVEFDSFTFFGGYEMVVEGDF